MAVSSTELCGHLLPQPVEGLRSGVPYVGQAVACGSYDALELVGEALAYGLLDRDLERLDCSSAVIGEETDLCDHHQLDPDGLTTIRDTQRHDRSAGYAGLGSGELAPHTERSGVPVPPRLMLLVCEQKADKGGECRLTDGRPAHADLPTRRPEAVVMLSKPRTVYFGAGNGYPSQVFTVYPGHRVSVRLRQDAALAPWIPLVVPFAPRFREAITRNQHRLSLAAGQAYLVDNERWMHARTEFSGDRRLLRALGEPRFAVSDGFAVDPTTVAVPLTVEVA